MTPARIAYKLVRYSGLPFLFRELLFRRATRIVVFHDPGPEAFDRALRYLRSRYNIITLAEHLSGRPLPPKPLVVTLDDGCIGNHALLGTIRSHGITPTLFLCAGIAGTNRHFWFLHTALTGSSEPFKTVPDTLRLSALEEMGFTPDREFDTPQALTREHIAAMKDHVDFQSHGMFHACLPSCSTDAAEEEIIGSKRRLERSIGAPITAFAFPNGDYCARDIDLVKSAGFSCALTVDRGFNRRGDDPYRLKRFSVDDSGDIDALSAKVSGVWSLLTAMIGRRRYSGFVKRPIAQPITSPVERFAHAEG